MKKDPGSGTANRSDAFDVGLYIQFVHHQTCGKWIRHQLFDRQQRNLHQQSHWQNPRAASAMANQTDTDKLTVATPKTRRTEMVSFASQRPQTQRGAHHMWILIQDFDLCSNCYDTRYHLVNKLETRKRNETRKREENTAGVTLLHDAENPSHHHYNSTAANSICHSGIYG